MHWLDIFSPGVRRSSTQCSACKLSDMRSTRKISSTGRARHTVARVIIAPRPRAASQISCIARAEASTAAIQQGYCTFNEEVKRLTMHASYTASASFVIVKFNAPFVNCYMCCHHVSTASQHTRYRDAGNKLQQQRAAYYYTADWHLRRGATYRSEGSKCPTARRQAIKSLAFNGSLYCIHRRPRVQ
jgi:hypothetical protein